MHSSVFSSASSEFNRDEGKAGMTRFRFCGSQSSCCYKDYQMNILSKLLNMHFLISVLQSHKGEMTYNLKIHCVKFITKTS